MLFLGSKLKKLKRINISLLPGLSTKYFLKSNKILKNNKAINSYYLLELIEKQKLKFNFCLKENIIKQYLLFLKKYKNLNFIINLRLDTFLHNIGFCKTILESRQWITHEHILVNLKIIKQPKFLLKKGDIISLNPNSFSIILLCKKNLYIKYNTYFLEKNMLYINICLFSMKCILLDLINIIFPFITFKNSLIWNYYN